MLSPLRLIITPAQQDETDIDKKETGERIHLFISASGVHLKIFPNSKTQRKSINTHTIKKIV